MSYSKLFICFMLCTVGFSTKTIAQSLYNPSLNPKNTATLIIDSIPVVNTQKYRLAGIDEPSNDYRLFFGSSLVSNQPLFGISRTRPFVVVQNNAFIHKSLFDPSAGNDIQNNTWDNPYNSDSFGQGVLAGSLQLISDIFR